MVDLEDWECVTCDGLGFVEDPSSCNDPEHCDPTMTCVVCDGTGEKPESPR